MKTNILVLISFSFFYFLSPSLVTAKIFKDQPIMISIPKVGIALPIVKSKIIFDSWEVSEEAANFGEGSAIPGTDGNTVIFGHALPSIFGELTKVSIGDKIHVFTKNDWFVYRVISTSTVLPEEIEILQQNNSYELTLFTCTGSFFSERFVVKATLLTDSTNLE